MQSQVMTEMPGLLNRNNPFVRLVARLQPGMTMSQGQAATQVVFRSFQKETQGPHPTRMLLESDAQTWLAVKSDANGFSPQREEFSQSLSIIAMVVGLVLLIACANVANLLLARSAARQRETAVRLALGAGRKRIIRQMLTESVMLSVVGGIIGFAFAFWGTRALAAVLASGPAQLDSRVAASALVLDLRVDLRLLAFSAALCMLTGIAFGMAPALRGTRISLSEALLGRGTVSGRSNLGKGLVVVQVALSLALLIGAGLFLRTLNNLKQQGLGVSRERVLLVWTVPGQTGRQGDALANYSRDLLDRLAAIPGVVSVSASNHGLLEGSDTGGASEFLVVPGQPPKPGLEVMRIAVAGRFFATTGMPLISGRDFNERDIATAPRVAILNETMARFHFGNEDPVGRRFGYDATHPEDTLEIVGVVKDAKIGTPRDRRGISYIPYRQMSNLMRNLCVEVRVSADPAAMAATVRKEIRSFDANLPVLKIDTIEEQLGDVLVQERLTAGLSSVFGGVAVFLACVGLYGVVSYSVARRIGEIGIRMALGASRASVLIMVLKESLWLVVAGTVIGVPVTVAASRLIASSLFGVREFDPLTIAVAISVMLGVAALAAVLPASRAARVEPMMALRYE